MRPHRSIIALFALTSIALTAAFAQQAADKPESSDASEKAPEQSPFPLVIRIDKSALLPFTNSEVDVEGKVDKMVLGAHAVGTSDTEGAIRAELIPDSTEAAFDLHFTGRTTTKTISTQVPAKVHSRTFTDFVCTRRVIFDPREGFRAVGETQVEGDTKLVYDGFASTKQLGSKIIVRIAERRSNQLCEQARQIADRDNKREVAESFEKDIERSLVDANKGTDVVRYVNQFLGENTKLQLHAKSSTDCIHIGVGPEGEKYEPMTALAPSREKPAPIEIWVHTSIVGKPATTVLKLAGPGALPLMLQTQILGALAMPKTSTGGTVDVALHDGWLVLGLNQDLPGAPTEPVVRRSTIQQ